MSIVKISIHVPFSDSTSSLPEYNEDVMFKMIFSNSRKMPKSVTVCVDNLPITSS